jgi:hypothetical protein
MSTRKGWDQLKPATQKRYIGAGISRADYKRGVSLSGARGHKQTPEHPLAADKPVPKQYQKWYNQRYNNPIKMLTDEGEQWLVSVSKRNRRWIGSHWNAVHARLFDTRAPNAWWWQGSSAQALDAFGRLTVRGVPFRDNQPLGDLETFHFMTDFDDIVEWTYEDTLSFESIYRNVA